MKVTNCLIIFVFLSLSIICPFRVYAQEKVDLDLFVWALDKDPVLSSTDKIEQLIRRAHQMKIKTLFVQVYRANKAWFATKHADDSLYQEYKIRLGRDPFEFLIKKAHENNIEVHAWLNVLSLSANTEAPLLKKYGTGILTRNKQDKKILEDYKIDNQYFLEPSDPRVRREMTSIVGDLLKGYPKLDGIQFDYIRYPDVHPFYGYSSYNIERFKKISGLKEIVEDSPKWKQFKRDQVTSLLQVLVKKTRSLRPKIHISTTGCLSYARAYHEALQDWPSWINQGLIEFVTVMNYPSDYPDFEKNVCEIKEKLGDLKKINVAVGAYKFVHKDTDIFRQQYEYCKKSGAKGCAIFHYSNFQENPALARALE